MNKIWILSILFFVGCCYNNDNNVISSSGNSRFPRTRKTYRTYEYNTYKEEPDLVSELFIDQNKGLKENQGEWIVFSCPFNNFNFSKCRFKEIGKKQTQYSPEYVVYAINLRNNSSIICFGEDIKSVKNNAQTMMKSYERR